MEHPEEIADLILARYSKQHPRAFYLFEAERMGPLLRTDLIDVGYMTRGRWRHIAATYADLGLLPHEYALDGFLYEPDSRPDLTELYVALALLTLVSVIALYIHRANRRLAVALDEKSRSEERHRIIFQTTASAGVVWRDGFIVTDWNRQAEVVFGWRREEVLGRSFIDFMVPASDRERLTAPRAAGSGKRPAPRHQRQSDSRRLRDHLRVVQCLAARAAGGATRSGFARQ
jgi:PAS domain S-box-containing protein